MNTQSILPETLVSGFLLLLSMILFVFSFLPAESTNSIFINLVNMSGGASVIIGSSFLFFSYVLGSLSHRIGADISSVFTKDNTNINIDGADTKILQEYYNSWAAKSFYRSTTFSFLLISTFSIVLDCKHRNGADVIVISILGFILLMASGISFFTQRKDYHKLRAKLLK